MPKKLLSEEEKKKNKELVNKKYYEKKRKENPPNKPYKGDLIYKIMKSLQNNELSIVNVKNILATEH